jgi:hypothetical protein
MAIDRYGIMRLRHNSLGVQVDTDVRQENEGTEILHEGILGMVVWIQSLLGNVLGGLGQGH